MTKKLTSRYRGESGTYISVYPDARSVAYLSKFLDGTVQGRYSQPGEMHITLAYSKATLSPAQQIDILTRWGASHTFRAKPSHFTAWRGHDGDVYLVLKLDSPDLTEVNSILQNEFGLVGNFPVYQPHVTIVSNVVGAHPPFIDIPTRGPELLFTGLRLEDAK